MRHYTPVADTPVSSHGSRSPANHSTDSFHCRQTSGGFAPLGGRGNGIIDLRNLPVEIDNPP